MTHSFDGYNHVIRLERGERLMAALEQFVAETKVDGAWLSGLGGATDVTLGYYNLDTKEYQWKTFPNLVEVTLLTGNLALDEAGKLVVHLHGTFAGEDYQSIGGHVQDLTAGATLELFVHHTYVPLHREHDDATGLNLLDLS